MKIEQPVKEMERMSGEAGLGREHYYLDFSAHLDENIDKVYLLYHYHLLLLLSSDKSSFCWNALTLGLKFTHTQILAFHFPRATNKQVDTTTQCKNFHMSDCTHLPRPPCLSVELPCELQAAPGKAFISVKPLQILTDINWCIKRQE